MTSDRSITKASLLVLLATALAACGGSNENASPGSVVIVEPCDNCDGGGGDPGDPGGPGDGPVVNSIIPGALSNVIYDSGSTASAAFGSKPIYLIDVSQLNGGRLDPTGLLLGNDLIFEISGGALRVSPNAGALAAGSADKDVVLEGSGGTVGSTALPDCQFELAPGAVVYGSSSSDFLVIEQGCAIIADGTAQQPIVFTAAADVQNTVEDGDRGLWGGVVINGFAPINDCPEGIEGGTAECTKEGEANSGTFGGNNPNDNSGILRYVTVRYAGSNVDPENQLNGIAFQGVGDETIVEYVQVHNNLDDGVEFFGGTVNAKYLVLTGNADDSMDWTDGWIGKVQYLYIEQTDSADNVIEADNREGDEGALPRSNPSIANMTARGNSGENALRLRRGTGLALTNSFVAGSATCMQVDGTSRDLLGTDLTVAGSSFACADMHSNDTDGAVEAYLNSAVNVSQSGGQVTPVPPADSFFEQTDFVGAFGAVNWTEGWTVPGSVSSAEQPDFGCPEGTVESARVIEGRRVCEMSGSILADLSLTANNYYELTNGKVTIGGDNANPATLTIQAGTRIFGATTSDFLVISRGSRIVANGTSTAPVVFTALADLEGSADEDADRGLWGGLVINGNAPINDCPQGIAGGTAACTKEGEANSGTFGGDQPDDDSGVLRYVVVKYAGSNVDPENQLNGIAFQGVGSGTKVEFVQVHNNLDDGIEFFGGTVSAKYVVLTGNADDSLDWTDGWQGAIQYLVIQQADDAGDNGIEADNREGNVDALPRSLPRIANMTIKGNAAERGIYLRRGTGLNLYNAVVEGSANCLLVAGDSLSQVGNVPGITFDGVSFNCGTVVEDGNATVQAELDASNVSQTGQAVPAADLSGDDFFDDAAFIGAVQDEDNDWTSGWTVGMPDTGSDYPCPDGTTEIAPVGGQQTCELAGTYSGDLVLTRDNYYVLNGKVTIGGDNANSGVLTINSGTTVIGDDAEDFLVISRGSEIRANGTQFSPVRMTSLTDVQGTANQLTDRGLWGGLVINGNAPINDCPEGVAGGTAACTKEGEANSGLFGGNQPNDSSGILNYVVVKFAGSNVDPENQLNGIAFQGVGSGTQVDYIQVHNNLDDGVEFFGGTVSAKHVVLTGNADDSLDWTDGWQGKVQYVHIAQASDAGDNGIEADNREGDELATPVSGPTIANMTILGKAEERGMQLRRGTGLQLFNSAVSGSATCLLVQGESLNQLGSGIVFEGVSLGCADIVEDDNANVQAFLDGSNVTQDGSLPAPAAVPTDGFFEQVDVIGSDVADWGEGWTVGLQ